MPTYKRFKTKIIVELESDQVINQTWVDRRFKELTNGKYVSGFKITPTLEPIWEEIPNET